MKTFFKILSIVTALVLSGCSVLLPDSVNPLRYQDAEIIGTEFNESAIETYFITPELLKRIAPISALSKANNALELQVANYQYVVGIGDVLNVTVWDHPELTTPAGSYRSAAESGIPVHSNGMIFYPYVGNVKVVGLTVNQIRQLLVDRLSDYIMDPQVDVSVVSYQSKKAYITGEVNKPGQQFISNVPLTLLDAINKAGGLSENADWDNVTITSKGRDQVVSVEALIQRGDLTQNHLLKDGDIVHIPRNDTRKVFVVGEVTKPQFLTIGRNGMTLMEAISASGGIDKFSADATGIFVIRGQRGKKELVRDNTGKLEFRKLATVYQLDVTNPTAYILATDFYLNPYDVVYVTTAPITRWNRVISQIVPTVAGSTNLRNIFSR